jgi:hypothetical protein
MEKAPCQFSGCVSLVRIMRFFQKAMINTKKELIFHPISVPRHPDFRVTAWMEDLSAHKKGTGPPVLFHYSLWPQKVTYGIFRSRLILYI